MASTAGSQGTAQAPPAKGRPRISTLERLGDCVLRLQALLGELRELLLALHEEQLRQTRAAGGEEGRRIAAIDRDDPRGGGGAGGGAAPATLRIAYGGGPSVLASEPASAGAARAALIAADMAMAGYTREEIIARLQREGGDEAARAGEQALE
jgi:hypothetical protein